MGAGASSATEAAKKATVEDERDLEIAEFALRLSISLDVQELKHAFSEASPEEVKKLSEALKALEGAGPLAVLAFPLAFPIRPRRCSAFFLILLLGGLPGDACPGPVDCNAFRQAQSVAAQHGTAVWVFPSRP